jgi:hypothetical protein
VEKLGYLHYENDQSAVFSLILFIIGSITSASAQSCPVEFIKIEPAQKQSWSRVGRSLTANDADRHHITNTPDFFVKLGNVSGKDIRGLKVQNQSWTSG